MNHYSILVILFINIFTCNVSGNDINIYEVDSENISQLIKRADQLLDTAPDSSLKIAEQLLKTFNKNTNSFDYCKVLYIKARANSYLENYNKALSDFQLCLSNPYFINDSLLLADLKFNIARCYDCTSDINTAIQIYLEAFKLYQKKKDIYGQAKVLQNIGIIESDKRRDSLAIAYYKKSLELYKFLKNEPKQAAILQNIGVVYLNQENYPKTIEYYNKALKIFISVNDPEDIASVENNLGIAYERLLKFQEALKHYDKALLYFKKINSRTGLAYIHDNLASLYRRLNKNETAITHYKLSIMYADSVQILDLLAFVNEEMASLLEEMGNYQGSLKYYKAANQIEDSISNEESKKRLAEAEALFHGELKDFEIQKKEIQLKAQMRENSIYLVALILLIFMFCFLVWAYRKKVLAENQIRKHQEILEDEVKQRTNELKLEMFERIAAEEADKLKTAFLANMSHEIRTPMNAILAFSTFLKDPDISGTQRNEYVKYINSCSISLLRLIDDILDTAKIEARQLKLTESACYVNSVLNELFVYFQNHKKCKEEDIVLQVKTDCIARNYIFSTDVTRLRQIFTNLLDNAFKFTEKGKIEFGFEIKDGFFQFYVSDTGSGIPKDKTELVFKRFGQVNDNSSKVYKGTGLGLSISKNLTELLGGKMWLESLEEKGTCFYFTIPANNYEVSELIKTSNDEYSLPQKSIAWKNFTILVAEDDDLNYKLIQIALNKTQANIIRAYNGEEVLSLLSENNNIHGVLMDIQMPVLDGYETTRRLKSKHPEIFVIAQTAFAMSDDKDKCLKAGCDDYISKPIDIDELHRKLGCHFEKLQIKEDS